jgi:hypothetical protein
MKFKCSTKFGKRKEEWFGFIKSFTIHKNYYELFIESRSSIMLIFGETSRGKFACIPDFGVGCHLVDLSNQFWNEEKLIEILGKIDGSTVAAALNHLAKNYDFEKGEINYAKKKTYI